MKDIFKPGDQKLYSTTVSATDVAAFHGEVVHAVCSTYAIARDMEWSSRLFVLELKEPDEEGVGTFVHVNHHAPAIVGQPLDFLATVDFIKGNEIVCNIEVRQAGNLVASGKTGQKVLKKEKLKSLFKS